MHDTSTSTSMSPKINYVMSLLNYNDDDYNVCSPDVQDKSKNIEKTISNQKHVIMQQSKKSRNYKKEASEFKN